MSHEPSHAAGKETYEITCGDDAFGVVHVGRVCIALWRGEVTLARVLLQRAELLRAVSKHRDGAAFICVVEPGASPPGASMRKASIDMINELGARLRCVACVIEGSGFRAAATRSALSGMALLLASRSMKLKFSSTVPEICPWVERHCEGASLESITGAYTQLREHLVRNSLDSCQP